MAVLDPSLYIDETLTVFVPNAGTPAGAIKGYIPASVRGKILQVGYMPNTLVTSTLTMAVAIGNQSSSAASNYTQVVTSTLGSFSSTNTFEGAVCSVVPASPTYITPGDSIQFTFSGGQHSSIGATAYAIVRRI